MRVSQGSNSNKSPKNSQTIKVRKRSQMISSSPDDLKRSVAFAQNLQHQKIISKNYRQKNQRNAIKCRFLYQKLSALGSLSANEVSEVDVKIRQLEFQLHFKRGEQMKKLRKKVGKFLGMINFQVEEGEMEKIEDQIQIVLFLLDIFEEKFNEMTAQRKQISQIIARLQQSSNVVHIHSSPALPEDSQHYKQQNQELTERISMLEAELNRIKTEEIRHLEEEIMIRDRLQLESREKGAVRQGEEEAGNGSKEGEGLGRMREIELTRKIAEIEGEMKENQRKYQVLNGNLERAKREEMRWKDRYRTMEAQKDQRIKILEESLSQRLKK